MTPTGYPGKDTSLHGVLEHGVRCGPKEAGGTPGQHRPKASISPTAPAPACLLGSSSPDALPLRPLEPSQAKHGAWADQVGRGVEGAALVLPLVCSSRKTWVGGYCSTLLQGTQGLSNQPSRFLCIGLGPCTSLEQAHISPAYAPAQGAGCRVLRMVLGSCDPAASAPQSSGTEPGPREP